MGGKILSTLIKTLKDPNISNSDSFPFDYWRDFFESAGTDIFELIDHAILIAMEDCPSEFSARRDQIIEACFSDQHNKINERSKSVDEVMSIKDSLANWDEKSESFLFELLKKLQKMEFSVETLEATNITKMVKHLWKHPSDRIRHLSKFLIYGWKLLKDESVRISRSSEVKSFDNVLAIKNVPPTQDVSTMSSSLTLPPLVSWEEGKLSKKIDELPFEAKLENTKKRLQEAYREESNAKKRRGVKMIDLKDLPKQDKPQEQRKINRRCCPEKRSNLHINYAHRLAH